MRTEKLSTVKAEHEKSGLEINNLIVTVVITAFLVTGFTMMYSTAMDWGFGTWSVLMFSLITSTIYTIIYNFKKKWLTVLAALIAPSAAITFTVFNIFNVQDGMLDFLYSIQAYSFYWIPGDFSRGVTEDPQYIFNFIEAYNLIAVAVTTLCLLRKKNIPLALLLYVPLFVCAVSNTTMTPKAAPCIAAATGVLLAMLAHGFRNKRAVVSGTALLFLAIPAVIFALIPGLIYPVEKYDKDGTATDILSDLVDLSEDISKPVSEILNTALHGIRNPKLRGRMENIVSLNAGSTNLKDVGPFNPEEGLEVLKVYKYADPDYINTHNSYTQTSLYLKVESLDIYKDNTLKSSKINMQVYKDIPAPRKASCAIAVEPVLPSSVDIVPYYTDFYTSIYGSNVNVNPYNTTKEGASEFALETTPLKVGDIYTDEYIEDYVYKTCLDVPKATEMALVSSGDLPDWYLDIYHGYVTVSDAEKVRKVTEYVRSLHYYDADTDYPPDNVDFVPWFVSEAKSGICVHYAATTVILLRMIGIPARYVRGYLDIHSYPNTTSTVYAAQGHAWFEFFVPEYGWIMGDSTPGNYIYASDYDITAVSKAYPEIEQASFSRGFTSRFNPDNTDQTTESDTPETTPSDSETETTPSTSGSENQTEPGQTDSATPTPADQVEASSTRTIPDNPSGGSSSGDADAAAETEPDFTIVFYPNGNVGVDYTGAKRFINIFTGIICAAGAIVLVLELLLFAWAFYWRRHFRRSDINEKAKSYYHYFELMSRIFRYSLPKKAIRIAEKAAFADGKIAPQELETLCKTCIFDMNEIAKGFNKYKRALFKALLVKITNK